MLRATRPTTQGKLMPARSRRTSDYTVGLSVVAPKVTTRLMSEIDKAIPKRPAI